MDWNCVCIGPLYKGDGDKNECSNSRSIRLFIIDCKLYGRVLIIQVKDGTQYAIGKDQC